jgi:hypothetical protein
MSKHPFASNFHSAASSRSNHGGLLTLAALLLGSLALPGWAQNRPPARLAPEKHLTIPPGAETPVVLRTEPDAACDLHAAGVNDPSQTMRLYANVEGYVRFHFTPNQGIQDAYLQLDCTTQQAVTTHPLHLRIDGSPTADMPAPEASVPAPAGSKVRPALTDEAARQLSDEDIIAQGYPPRPNAAESPEAYAKWLDRVSRPMTIVPPHSVKRSDISHLPRTAIAGPNTSSNWSGFVAQGSNGSYRLAQGEWTVPSVLGEVKIVYEGRLPTVVTGPQTYSALWVGLDGNNTKDLVQAGTEQNAQSLPLFGTATSYFAWTEVCSLESGCQPMQEVLSVGPNDGMDVSVYVGDSAGNLDPSGGYAWFYVYVYTATSAQGMSFPTSLGTGFGFTGNSAEWIMERPYITALGNNPNIPDAELADYNTCQMVASVFTTASIPYSYAQAEPTIMYEGYSPQSDDDELSTVSAVSGQPSAMLFTWKSFH